MERGEGMRGWWGRWWFGDRLLLPATRTAASGEDAFGWCGRWGGCSELSWLSFLSCRSGGVESRERLAELAEPMVCGCWYSSGVKVGVMESKDWRWRY